MLRPRTEIIRESNEEEISKVPAHFKGPGKTADEIKVRKKCDGILQICHCYVVLVLLKTFASLCTCTSGFI